MTRSRESAVVVTVAVRGVRAISAISPKKSPRLSVRTLRPLRCTSASPSMRTKNSRPSAPSRMNSLPGPKSDLIGELRDLREFLLRAAREQWDALDRLNLRVTRERHDASHQSVGYSRRRSTIANDRQRLQRIRPDANPPGDLSISSPVDSPARVIAKHVLLGRRETSLTCYSRPRSAPCTSGFAATFSVRLGLGPLAHAPAQVSDRRKATHRRERYVHTRRGVRRALVQSVRCSEERRDDLRCFRPTARAVGQAPSCASARSSPSGSGSWSLRSDLAAQRDDLSPSRRTRKRRHGPDRTAWPAPEHRAPWPHAST